MTENLPKRAGNETPNLRGQNMGGVAHPKDWVGEGNKPLMRSLTAMCSRSLDGMAPQNFSADRVGVCLCCGRVGSIPPMMHVCRVCFAELEAER
jgi:hypothetical protein